MEISAHGTGTAQGPQAPSTIKIQSTQSQPLVGKREIRSSLPKYLPSLPSQSANITSWVIVPHLYPSLCVNGSLPSDLNVLPTNSLTLNPNTLKNEENVALIAIDSLLWSARVIQLVSRVLLTKTESPFPLLNDPLKRIRPFWHSRESATELDRSRNIPLLFRYV